MEPCPYKNVCRYGTAFRGLPLIRYSLAKKATVQKPWGNLHVNPCPA